MTPDDYFRAVIANPEDDVPRLRYAEALQEEGDQWGRFVELQVKRVREQRFRHETGDSTQMFGAERGLFLREHAGSVRQILKYTVPSPYTVYEAGHVEFHRGFVVRIECHPRIFLEHGDYLFKIAPLRGIDFPYPHSGEERLLDAVLASPLLQRLDYVGFSNWGCPPEEVARIFECPNLTRCLHLDLKHNDVWNWPKLPRTPLLRQLLRLDLDGGPARRWHHYEEIPSGGRFVGRPVSEYLPTTDRGQALEAELGYLPWLHPYHNAANTWDLRYFLEAGVLPDRPAGSPVDYHADPEDGDPEARRDHQPPVTHVNLVRW